MDQVGQKLAELAPQDADLAEVAQAIVTVVDTPKGTRPFRVHIDPADDGADVSTRSPTGSAGVPPPDRPRRPAQRKQFSGIEIDWLEARAGRVRSWRMCAR